MTFLPGRTFAGIDIPGSKTIICISLDVRGNVNFRSILPAVTARSDNESELPIPWIPELDRTCRIENNICSLQGNCKVHILLFFLLCGA